MTSPSLPPAHAQRTFIHRYDQDATNFMDSVRLMHMIQHIEEPWGFGQAYNANEKELIDRVSRLNLPIYRPLPGTSNRVQVRPPPPN